MCVCVCESVCMCVCERKTCVRKRESGVCVCMLCLSIAGNGIVLMSIDNLPAQLPREATDYFGTRLLPFIPDMVHNTTVFKTPYNRSFVSLS